MKIKLSTKQAKWLKKHKHKLGVEEIAEHLSLSNDEVKKIIGIKEVRVFSKSYEKHALMVLLGVAFLVLATSLPNQFVSDDVPAILNNPLITSWSNVTVRWLGSFQNLIYFVLTNIFGVVPWPLRLTNIIFHLITAGLLYAIVRRTQPFVIALTSCALFVMAPTILEPVIWISGMPYVLGGMMTMLCLFLHLDDQKTATKNWLEIIAWSIALTTNEKFIFVPVLLLIWDWYQMRLPQTRLILLALLTVSLFRGIGLLSMLGDRVEVLQTDFYNSSMTRVDNPISKVLVATGYYLYLYLWPKELTLYHSEIDLGWMNVARYGGISLFAGLVVWMAGKKRKEYVFWGTFFVVSMIPVLFPFGVSSLVAERYAYLGYAGVAVILSILIFDLSRKIVPEFVIKILLGLVIVAMMGRSLVRIRDWKTADNLWFSAEKISPSSWQNHNNLGDAYANQGNFTKSIEEFTKAIDLNPLYADAVHNRANSYLKLGDMEKAKQGFTEAVRLNPKLWQSYVKLSEIEEFQKRKQ